MYDKNSILDTYLKDYFPRLSINPHLKETIIETISVMEFATGTTLLRQGQSITHLPLVVEGLVKVFKQDDSGNEVLLYYIKPGESCIMSFQSILGGSYSHVRAIVERDTTCLLLPAKNCIQIAKQYPEWHSFILRLYDEKYNELVAMIELLTFSKKEKRLIDYLQKESTLKGTKDLNTTHKQIAIDLGSTREVISRLLKKLEHDGKIKLNNKHIKILF